MDDPSGVCLCSRRYLEQVYNTNDSVLRNLFSFTDAILDIKGYGGAGEFAKNFPFVPYQFILMQKVFAEIRKHGNSGKHLSGGERSMLSGFQEAAQTIEDKDEYALAPFYLFYDTVHTFLESSIRRVIERCERAAADGNGIEPQDVDVLKFLYLVRYVDDVKANLDNIVILMADDIRLDKITMHEQVRGSLDRLMSQNNIGRTGDTYNFLTDEEQDIQREIKNTPVATADIVATQLKRRGSSDVNVKRAAGVVKATPHNSARANPEKIWVLMKAVFRRNTLCISRKSDKIRAQIFQEVPKADCAVLP